MSQDHLVSICIPVFNQHKFIRRAVQSALDQTHEHTEIIVVDNASTPPLKEELASFENKIRYVRNEDHVPMYENFNRSLALASGEYVKFLAADDELATSFIATALELFKLPNVVIANLGEVLIDEESRELPTPTRHPERSSFVSGAEAMVSLRNGLPYCVTPSHSLYRTKLLKRFDGFNPRFLYSDFHSWLHLLTIGNLGWSSEPLTRFRLHSSNAHLGTKGVEFFEEMMLIMDDLGLDEDVLIREFLTAQYAEVFWSTVLHRYAKGRSLNFPRCMRRRDVIIGAVKGIGGIPAVLSRRLMLRRIEVTAL
jgi:hypothetical protein